MIRVMAITLDVVDQSNKKVDSLELQDEVFGGRVNDGLVWEAVVHENASARRGTHATKNRAAVRGSGRKVWRQKGTGRARVGSIRTPLWRSGGTVFGPQPRSYSYALPKKVRRGALRAALTQRIKDGALIVVDELALSEAKTKAAVELLAQFGTARKTLLIDVKPDESLVRAVRNLVGVQLRQSGSLTARDVADVDRVIATRASVERLQEVLKR